MTTYLPAKDGIKRVWHEIDAGRYTLGRLASKAAVLLRGKHKAVFTPHMDVGDFVVITNAKNVKITGRKRTQKKYFRFSGYPGGITSITLKEKLEKKPEDVVRIAVRGMLAPNRLRRLIMRRLKIVAGDKHSFQIDKTL